MLTVESLQRVLQDRLPPQDHERARHLAALIVSVAESAARGEIDRLATGPELVQLLQRLAGAEIPMAEGVISIAAGAQVGEVKLRDVAGQSIFNITIVTPIPDTSPTSQIAVLVRPRSEVEAELRDLFVRGKGLQEATAGMVESSSTGDFYDWATRWHTWHREIEVVLARAFSTLAVLNRLREYKAKSLYSTRPSDLAQDVAFDMAFLEDLLNRLPVYDRPSSSGQGC